MVCLNEFCIYNTDNECIFEEISLDISGVCECCILVDIDKNILNESKKNILESHNN